MWPSLMNICVAKLRTKPDNTNCGCRKNEFGFQMRNERKKDDKEAATSRDVDDFLIWIISYRDTAHKTRPNEQVFRTGTCRAPRSTDRPTDQACIYSCISICSCSWRCQCICTCFYGEPGTLDGLSAAAATFWATQQVKLQQEPQQQKSKINKQKECRRAAFSPVTVRVCDCVSLSYLLDTFSYRVLVLWLLLRLLLPKLLLLLLGLLLFFTFIFIIL